jgi:hypothetical protein
VQLARSTAYAALGPGATAWSPAATQSQAYCGPGHGQRWPVETGSAPPDVVQLETPDGTCSYRLLLHPRTRGPARDQQGRYSYLPVAPVARGLSTAAEAGMAAGGLSAA